MQKTVLQSRLLAQPFVLRTPELQSKVNEIVKDGVLIYFIINDMEKKIDVIKAWKDSNYRNSLSQEQLNSIEMNPIGEPLENIGNLFGGANQPIKSSAGDGFKGCGWFGSISAECNGGNCCNPFYSWG